MAPVGRRGAALAKGDEGLSGQGRCLEGEKIGGKRPSCQLDLPREGHSVIADSVNVRFFGKLIPSKVLEGRKILLDAS
jgi:hypothetical protein